MNHRQSGRNQDLCHEQIDWADMVNHAAWDCDHPPYVGETHASHANALEDQICHDQPCRDWIAPGVAGSCEGAAPAILAIPGIPNDYERVALLILAIPDILSDYEGVALSTLVIENRYKEVALLTLAIVHRYNSLSDPLDGNDLSVDPSFASWTVGVANFAPKTSTWSVQNHSCPPFRENENDTVVHLCSDHWKSC